MHRFHEVLVTTAILVLLAACDSQGSDIAPPVLDGTADPPQITGTTAYTPIQCARNGVPRVAAAWIGNEGTQSNQLRIRGSSHELTVREGVIPAGEQHLYVIYERMDSDAGCQVVVQRLVGDAPPESPPPYRLAIQCEGHGDPSCPATHLLRLESNTPIPGTPGQDASVKYMSADLASLSTYALAAPGGRDSTQVPGDSTGAP